MPKIFIEREAGITGLLVERLRSGADPSKKSRDSRRGFFSFTLRRTYPYAACFVASVCAYSRLWAGDPITFMSCQS